MQILITLSALAITTPPPPNILLLFPDEWRYDWDGIYTRINTGEMPLHLPTVKEIASEGVRFTQAYVPAPVCSPSRSCLASGREYDEAGVPTNFANDYPITQETFYKRLRDEGGYHTMLTGKDDLTKATQLGYRVNYSGCSYCVDGDGLYHQSALGFSDGLRYSGKDDVIDTPLPHEMYGFYLNNHTVALPNGTSISGWESHRACLKNHDSPICTTETYPEPLYEDDWTASNALTLLRRKPTGKPWFLQVSFPGPHPPFSVTTKMRNSVAGRVWPGATDYTGHHPNECGAVTQPDNNFFRCNYGAEIENIDRLFKMIIDEVKSSGEYNNTLICISSDHGEMLDDHNDEGKERPWQGSASVPLICSGPGVVKNKTHSLPVATLDLSATFLDYANVSLGENMTAVSLRPLLSGSSSYKPFVSSGLNNWRMSVQHATSDSNISGSYKYICCNGECPSPPSTAPSPTKGWTQMLIDVSNDEFDMKDIAPLNPKLVEKMRVLLPSEYAEGCKNAYL